ncbi:GNAT family N-acetyltransferase [Peribacillus sp. SCS-155]|uniref:GNAT family N-acetyltransferase n=1 Tax=Peribacillus sedimenti TaxID=3115297 RepID=UPI0039068634
MRGNVTLHGSKLVLRNPVKDDWIKVWQLAYGEKDPEWKKWDAPYFRLEPLTLEEYIISQNEREALNERENLYSQLVIEAKGELIGTIGFYWEHKGSRWLEIGITIYNPEYWNGGFGTEALTLYIDYLFNNLDVERVGLTTWSGNERMIAASKKVGMIMEGRMRKCRYYNGVYYDSIRMGMIREEWESMRAETEKDSRVHSGFIS